MSARGVTAQELPENQDPAVAGVVQNEILHGHVRPAAALEPGEAPAAGAAVDAFTASLVVDTVIPEGFDNPEEPASEPEEPVEEPVEEPAVVEGEVPWDDGGNDDTVVEGENDAPGTGE